MTDPRPEMNQDFAPPPAPEPPLPAEQLVLNDGGARAPLEVGPEKIVTAPPLVVARPPGPGFLESIAWMIGMYAVQLGAIVLAFGLVFARAALTGKIDPAGSGPADLANKLQALFREDFLAILGVSQVATIVYGLLAIQFRIRPRGVRRLGLSPPSPDHWLLVALLMLPMWFLSSALMNALLQWMPWAEASLKDSMDVLAQSPLWLLALVVGLQPAVAEELVFRGLIGRGLIARWGLVPGILVTSILFGVMHLHPVQGISVIPLGLAMHYAYYTTRSFWAPMTLHSLNNLLSVVLIKYRSGTPGDAAVETDSGLPIPLLVVSAATVLAICAMLWKTRVHYVLRDGSVWNPGYATTEAPRPEDDAIAMRQRTSPLLLAVTTIVSLGVVAAAWQLAT